MGWSGLETLPWFWEPFKYRRGSRCQSASSGRASLAFFLGYLLFRSRMKGVYFSIVTQALAMILSTFLVGQQAYTGGTNGLTNYIAAVRRDPQRSRARSARSTSSRVVFLVLAYAVRALADGHRGSAG